MFGALSVLVQGMIADPGQLVEKGKSEAEPYEFVASELTQNLKPMILTWAFRNRVLTRLRSATYRMSVWQSSYLKRNPNRTSLMILAIITWNVHYLSWVKARAYLNRPPHVHVFFIFNCVKLFEVFRNRWVHLEKYTRKWFWVNDYLPAPPLGSCPFQSLAEWILPFDVALAICLHSSWSHLKSRAFFF